MRSVQDLDVLSEPAGHPRRPLAAAVFIAVVVIVADQLTKLWAVRRLELGRCVDELDNCIDVVWTLRLHLVENPGAAFSTGTSLGPLFGVIAIVMTVVLLNVARHRTDVWGPRLFGLIAGGAVGNLLDRIFRADDGPLSGHVIDFIDFQWWPVFNVADSAVVVGVVVFLVYSFFDPEAAGGARPDTDGSDPDGQAMNDSGDVDQTDTDAGDEATAGDDEVTAGDDDGSARDGVDELVSAGADDGPEQAGIKQQAGATAADDGSPGSGR